MHLWQEQLLSVQLISLLSSHALFTLRVRVETREWEKGLHLRQWVQHELSSTVLSPS